MRLPRLAGMQGAAGNGLRGKGLRRKTALRPPWLMAQQLWPSAFSHGPSCTIPRPPISCPHLTASNEGDPDTGLTLKAA